MESFLTYHFQASRLGTLKSHNRFRTAHAIHPTIQYLEYVVHGVLVVYFVVPIHSLAKEMRVYCCCGC